MDKINHCINHNRFIPIDTEELSALELIGKGTEKTNELVVKSNDHEERITNNENKKVSFDDMKEKFKFDNNFSDIDYRGKWFGLDEPTLSDEGMRSQVQKNRDDIIKANEQLESIAYLLPKPNGIDDTETINREIKKGYENGYRVFRLVNGIYKIKAHIDGEPEGGRFLKDEGGIELLDNISFEMDKGVTLQAITNDKKAYNVIRIYNKRNVKVTGGTIIGERDTHIGNTGEFGYGIAVTGGVNITIEGTEVSNCFGDGINNQMLFINDAWSATNGLYINRVKCTANRRQGISIEGAVNFSITNSILQSTDGTYPQAGIDIEPFNNGVTWNTARNGSIDNNVFINNSGPGVLIAGNDYNIRNISVTNNKFEANCKNVGEGQISVKNSKDIVVSGNICSATNQFDIEVTGASDTVITDNILTSNVRFIKGSKLNANKVSFKNNKITLAAIKDAVLLQDGSTNIEVVGNYIKALDTTSDTGRVIGIVNGNGFTIKDNIIVGFSRGFNISKDVSDVSILGNEIKDCGITVGTISSNYTTIDSNKISGSCWNNNNQPTLTILNSPGGLVITNNTFIQDVISGISRGVGKSNRCLSFSGTGVTNSVIINNTIIGTNYNLYFEADRPGLTSIFSHLGSIMSGTTEQRPTYGLYNGFMFFDTTENKVKIYKNTTWQDI